MRGKRQQDIIKAIAKKATSFTSITKFDDVIDAIGDNMKTDITFSEMKSFFKYFTEGVPEIESLSLEGYDDHIDGIYYYQLDQESLMETQHILQSHLEITPNTSNISGTDNSTNYSSTDSSTNTNTTNYYNSSSTN